MTMEKSEDKVSKLATVPEMEPKPSKPKNRRGRGSRAKAAERYRTHKNETVGARIIQARIERFKMENAYMPEDYFGPMCADVALIQPPQPVQISTHLLLDVAKESVKTLVNACKVPTPDIEKDIETVQLVSSLQLEAKLRFAQKSTPFQTTSQDEDTRADLTVRNADVALLPIAVMLEQIGVCEVDDQTFVPVEEIAHDGLSYSSSYSKIDDPSFVGRDGLTFTGERWITVGGQSFDMTDQCINLNTIGLHGGDMFFQVRDAAACLQAGVIDANFVMNPNFPVVGPQLGAYVELRRFNPKPPPSEVFQRYSEFLARVQKKVGPDKLPKLHLENGVGTEAQLSFSGSWVGDYRDVYAARKITGSALFFGAAFELNVVQQPLTDETVCVVRTSVNTRNALPRLMQCLSQRVERK